MRKLIFLCLFCLVTLPVASQAAPIYLEGNECPTDAQMPSYTRQYSVPQALRCMFITETEGNIANPVGNQDEADDFLNTSAANAAGWGTAASADDWVGLGKSSASSVLNGFTFTTDAGNDDGTFTFSGPLSTLYGQFAVGVKDGGAPKFAIFELPVGLLTGDWHFMTNGGELSHFALYGRKTFSIEQDCLGCDPDITEVPEPATLLLLGSGLTFAARRRRAKR